MKPAPFAYVRPDSVEAALAALADGGPDAKLLAGGQSLIPAMNFRLAEPSLLVDLGGIPDLAGIDPTAGGGIRIGAMTRQRAVERSAAVAERAPLVSRAMRWIAHPQIRNRGTIGGSLAHADPAAELPAVMLVLDATYVLRGPGGERRVAAGDFYRGLFATALASDELLAAIELPPSAPGSAFAIDEVARRHGDFALAGVAAGLALAPDGTVEAAAIAMFGVGDGPVACPEGAATLVGGRPDDAAFAAAADAAAARLDPPGDIHASAEFRRHLARVLTVRTLRRARDGT